MCIWPYILTTSEASWINSNMFESASSNEWSLFYWMCSSYTIIKCIFMYSVTPSVKQHARFITFPYTPLPTSLLTSPHSIIPLLFMQFNWSQNFWYDQGQHLARLGWKYKGGMKFTFLSLCPVLSAGSFVLFLLHPDLLLYGGMFISVQHWCNSGCIKQSSCPGGSSWIYIHRHNGWHSGITIYWFS